MIRDRVFSLQVDDHPSVEHGTDAGSRGRLNVEAAAYVGGAPPEALLAARSLWQIRNSTSFKGRKTSLKTSQTI